MAHNLADIQKIFDAGQVQQAAQALVAFCNAMRGKDGPHKAAADLAEVMGLVGLARQELNLAAKFDPGDADVLVRLSDLYMEQGDTQKAVAMLERAIRVPGASMDALRTLVELYQASGRTAAARDAVNTAIEHGMDAKQAKKLIDTEQDQDVFMLEQPPEPKKRTLLPTDEDVMRFLHLFSGRENMYARQWYSATKGRGGYSPVHEPLTPRVLRRHFMGDITVGVYPLRLDNTAGFFAFDIDIARSAMDGVYDPGQAALLRREVRKAADAVMRLLDDAGFDFLLESSGYKGFHVWVFLEAPLQADVLWNLGRHLMGRLSGLLPAHCHVEFFPKQPRRTGKGLGNLIKLPLGIHMVTGKRSSFLDRGFNVVDAPFDLLRSIKLVTRQQVHDLVGEMKSVFARAPATEPVQGDKTPNFVVPGPAPGPYWTEADFEIDPEVSHLLKKCPVLAALKRKADENGVLSYDEAMVVRHTMGHLTKGVLVVNHIFEKCANLSGELNLKSRLRGNPMSCPKIRSRIPHITETVNCNCDFGKIDTYPTPLLHLRTMPVHPPQPEQAPPAPAADVEAVARRYLRLKQMQQQIEQDLGMVTANLYHVLAARPEHAIDLPEGRLQAVMADGVQELKWQPTEEKD